MSIKLIVFDWDGTLIDSAGYIVQCMQKATADAEIPTPDDASIRNIIGLGLTEAMQTLFPSLSAKVYPQLVEAYRKHFFQGDDPSSLFDGVEDTLEALLERGYQLAVATGKSRRGLDRALKETQLGRLFGATRCADETASKPHPKMLLELFEVYQIRPEESVMVGDTEYDIQMAQRAGAHAVGVSYGVHHKDRLLDLNPRACIDDIRQLIQYVT